MDRRGWRGNNKDGEYAFRDCGRGVQLDLMRDKVERMGISGRIASVGQSTDVASWLKRMDLFFLTSRVEVCQMF